MKKIAFTFFLCFFSLYGIPQQSFIKTTNEGNLGIRSKILATDDNGWVILTLDSLKLCKFDNCGINEWCYRYKISINNLAFIDNFIKTKSGGFAFLTRSLDPSSTSDPWYRSLITVLDKSGNIVWSKSYGDGSNHQTPYSLCQGNDGSFILYGVTATAISNFICKIDSNGNQIWSKKYGLGGVVGDAIITSDNGVLVRAGTYFMKVDASGDVEWANTFNIISNNSYRSPIEVSNGYIFAGNVPSAGDFNTAFYKMDTSGKLLWGGNRKKINYAGAMLPIKSKNNGNFIGIFNKNIGSKNYISIIEFDSNLVMIKQNTINHNRADYQILANDFSFLNDSTPVIMGYSGELLEPPFVSIFQDYFFAKLNQNYQSGCDTLIEINYEEEPITQIFLTVNQVNYNINMINHNIPMLPFTIKDSMLCKNNFQFSLSLGKDTSICHNTTLSLQNNTGNVFEKYEWSTGAVTPSISINESGQYWLKAIYNCGMDTLMDSIIVTKKDFPSSEINSDGIVCHNKSIFLNAEIPNATYLWKDGTTDSKLLVNEPGEYYVDITFDGCTKRHFTDVSSCEFIPNIFTPNGDGQNDFFGLRQFGLQSIHSKIFNRWGEVVYEWGNVEKEWDGTIQSNGENAPEGVYYYIIELKNYQQISKKYTGFIHLIR